MSKKAKQTSLSLRSRIALATGLIASLIWSLLAFTSYETTQRLLDLTATQAFASATTTISNQLLLEYKPVQQATTLLTYSELASAENAEQRLALMPQLTQTLQELPTATAIQVGTQSGDFFIVRRVTEQTLLDRFAAPSATMWVVDNLDHVTRHNERWFYSSSLQLLGHEVLPESDYDPRVRPWFEDAIAATETVFTEPYVFFFLREIGITATRASRDKNSVVAIDVELSAIKRSLSAARVSPSSVSAITVAKGVLAWSGEDSVLHELADGQLVQKSISELGSPILNAAASASAVEGWRVHKATIPISSSIRPVLTIAVPGDELIADLAATRLQTLAISFLLLGMAIPLTWLMASRVSQPIRDLHHAIEKVGSGDFEFSLPPVIRNDEVGGLNNALRTMRGSLKQYIADLAQETAARERFESELDIAKRIQMSLVPANGQLGQRGEGYEIFARLDPARAVGGDLYDYIELPDGRIFIAVGDVSDKGIPAALFMARTTTLMRMLVDQTDNLGEFFVQLNDELSEANDECMFITLFCGIFEPQQAKMRYACAGHNPPLLIHNQRANFLELEAGTPLGLFPGNEYQQGEFDLHPGDVLIAYSDGITEAFNVNAEEFGEDRLATICHQQQTASVPELGNHILSEVMKFRGEAEQSDDITLLLLERLS
jgi:sigma-B regulation protein RsbU (phosphoserine phosphatase)